MRLSLLMSLLLLGVAFATPQDDDNEEVREEEGDDRGDRGGRGGDDDDNRRPAPSDDDQEEAEEPEEGSGGGGGREREISDTPRIVAYYQSVYHEVGYDIADINGDYMTHFVYSFLIMQKDKETGEVTAIPGKPKIDTELVFNEDTEECDCCAAGSYRQAFLFKRKYPHVKTILSIGGWSQSDFFSDAVATAEQREIFADSVTKYMIDYEFDGIDIDWEFPTADGEEGNSVRPEDGENLAMFVEALRERFAKYEEIFEKKIEITVAVAAVIQDWLKPGGNKRANDVFVNMVDYILVMGYEYNWGSEFSRHHANLFDSEGAPENVTKINSDKAMKLYEDAGFTRNQLVLGIAAYCRTFEEVSGGENGLLGRAKTNGDILPYREQTELEDQGYTWEWDDAAQAGYYWNESKKVMWSCEDKKSVLAKADYVDSNGYGGLMLWDVGNDVEDGDGSLLQAMAETLTKADLETAVDRGNECPLDDDDEPLNTFCNMGCQDEEEELSKVAKNDDTLVEGGTRNREVIEDDPATSLAGSWIVGAIAAVVALTVA